MNDLTSTQLRYLISLQNKSHQKGFVRSLENAQLLRSRTEWKKAGTMIPKGAEPVATLRHYFSGQGVKEWGVFAKDQSEVQS